MIHSIRFFSLAACVLLAACSPDPDATPPEPAEQTISLEQAKPVTDTDRMMSEITELSSDEYGGREPMSEGEDLTLEFIETRLRDLGLEPLFGDSYRQPVDLVSIEADPATARMTFHLQGRDRLVTHEREMVVGTMRTVPESRVENSEVVFVGYGIVAPEYNWNDYADIDVRGKTVLILINDPGFATQDPDLFRGNAMTYYGRWTYKFEEAARQGAAAAVIIHDTAPAAYGWEVVRNSWTGPQFHMHRDNDNMDRVPIESWVQHEVAEEIVDAAGLELADLEQRALSPEFRAVPLGSTVDASVQNRIITRQSYNIGALLPGSERPEEAFLYTAHWDHIGTDPNAAEGEDAIYNGAVDNASGIAALLELARSFANLPRAPERSVAFLAVTAEESGLLGSAWYADNPPIPMHRTVAGVNMDSMHVYGPTHDVIVVGYGSSELEDILVEQAARQNRIVKPEEHPERGSYYRSDHFNFARKGVPMLYAESGSEHTELGPEYIQAKSSDYLKNRYHTPLDEVGDDWDLRGLAQDIELYFGIGLQVADGDAWPNWYEGNEFRAIRDHSLSAATAR
ncbi:M28 family metallopeptidase [Elongatibacter sediminis]|uniref:M28 family metallopeptidase n=1 Tax=Elongatibacter sediminis TaxID=3119006 RepID=A0AAW9RCT4_9GAMM